MSFSCTWKHCLLWTLYLLPCDTVSRQSAPWPLPSSIVSFPLFCLLANVAFNIHWQWHFFFLSVFKVENMPKFSVVWQCCLGRTKKYLSATFFLPCIPVLVLNTPNSIFLCKRTRQTCSFLFNTLAYLKGKQKYKKKNLSSLHLFSSVSCLASQCTRLFICGARPSGLAWENIIFLHSVSIHNKIQSQLGRQTLAGMKRFDTAELLGLLFWCRFRKDSYCNKRHVMGFKGGQKDFLYESTFFFFFL